MPTADITIKTGDRRPYVDAVLKDASGAVNITGSTSYFVMETLAEKKIIYGKCTITNATGGAVRYSWGSTDTTTAGNYRAEFVTTFGDGRQATFPNTRMLDVEILRSASTST